MSVLARQIGSASQANAPEGERERLDIGRVAAQIEVNDATGRTPYRTPFESGADTSNLSPLNSVVFCGR